jgi:hypothetical protein
VRDDVLPVTGTSAVEEGVVLDGTGDHLQVGSAGTVLFGKSGYNALQVFRYGGETLTNGPGVTVHGSSGTLGNGYGNGTIVNQGGDQRRRQRRRGPRLRLRHRLQRLLRRRHRRRHRHLGRGHPAPQAVWQSYRTGYDFTYALTRLTPGASYTVSLGFAEPSHTAAGQRRFDVRVNGATALSAFDIYVAAGGKDKAVVRSFGATADAGGQIAVRFFNASVDTALVNGIVLQYAASQVVQAINCGDLAGGTLTVNPGTIQNQGTLAASNGEKLSVSSLASNAGLIAAGLGGTISISGGLTQATSGTISTTLGGTAAGQFGQLAVSGAVSFDGTLRVTLTNGLTPVSGNTFTVLTFASLTGTFAITDLPDLGSLTMTPVYNVSDLTLMVK